MIYMTVIMKVHWAKVELDVCEVSSLLYHFRYNVSLVYVGMVIAVDEWLNSYFTWSYFSIDKVKYELVN